MGKRDAKISYQFGSRPGYLIKKINQMLLVLCNSPLLKSVSANGDVRTCSFDEDIMRSLPLALTHDAARATFTSCQASENLKREKVSFFNVI